MSDLHLEASGYAVLTEEPNLMRAHWVAGAIEEAGIPVHVEDEGPADEFAVSQRAMGLLRVRVLVPADRLEEARTIFLSMSQPIPVVDEEDEELAEFEEARRSRGFDYAITAFTIVGLAALVIVTWQSCAQQRLREDDRPLRAPEAPRHRPAHPIHR